VHLRILLVSIALPALVATARAEETPPPTPAAPGAPTADAPGAASPAEPTARPAAGTAPPPDAAASAGAAGATRPAPAPEGTSGGSEPLQGFRDPLDAGRNAPEAWVTAGPALRQRRRAPFAAPPEPPAYKLLWVPRVAFFPLFLVTEYLVRWPLEFVTESVERHHLLKYYTEYTSWDDGKGHVAPTFSLRSGAAPSIGIAAFWNDAFVEGNDYAAAVDSNFDRVLTVDALTRAAFARDAVVATARFRIERRDDFLFHGIGARTSDDDDTRFYRNKVFGSLGAQVQEPRAGFGADLVAELSRNRFDCSATRSEDICGPDDQAGTADDRLPIDMPAGASFFTGGYELFRVKLLLSWDTRRGTVQHPAAATGLRLEAFGRWATGLDGADDIRFLRYGGELAGFWEVVPGYGRVLSARARVELAEPTGGGDIPFAELITLGGPDQMRGFQFARFHGRSTALASLDYRYPVWSFVDGTLFAELGNAFAPELEDFAVDLLRGAFGLGLRTIGSKDVSLNFLLAAGTEPLGDGLEVESVNLVIGTNWGY
jgi:hypothetical protein